MKRFAILIYVVGLLHACGPAEKPVDWADDGLGAWLDYYELAFEGFEKAHRFDRQYEVTYDYKGMEDDVYADFYIFNADSTKAIDLDSYHLALEKRDDGTLYSPGRGPDMEAGLINFEERQKKRMLFCGTPCIFEEATFDPEENIVIAGHVENEQGFRPVLWIMSPDNSYIEQHDYAAESERTHPAKEIRYISDIRLKEVTFWHDEKEHWEKLDVPL